MIKRMRESSTKLPSARANWLAIPGVIWIITGVALTWTSEAIAQTAPSPQFEVASIKLAAPDARGQYIKFGQEERIEITDLTLREVIAIAWRLQRFRVSGGPPWLDSIHYDIAAKTETKSKPDEVALMMQSLLKDRFQLKVHQETRELPIDTLVMARKDAKLGPRLIEPKEGSCTPRDPGAISSPAERDIRFCGQWNITSRRYMAVSVPIANLTATLAQILGHPVLDRTGLTGNFDILLEWSPSDLRAVPAPSDTVNGPGKKGGGEAEKSFPLLPAALQEQLGLKLDSRKGPVEILVVDGAEKPSEN